MTKIYIVTAGSYSDYHLVAAFSTEEKAREYVDKNIKLYKSSTDVYLDYGSGDMNIEIFDVDSPESHGNVLNEWIVVEMDKEGNGIIIDTNTPWVEGHLSQKDNKIRGQVLAFDKQHALKIANEYRSLLLNEGLWKE